jgi:hypothetical protein
MSVRTYLELSTAHITERDAQILEQGITDEFISGQHLIFPRICLKDDFGYFISVAGVESSEGIIEEYRRAGMSEEFINLVLKADHEGHWYLRLDCDAEIDETLPKFDW